MATPGDERFDAMLEWWKNEPDNTSDQPLPEHDANQNYTSRNLSDIVRDYGDKMDDSRQTEPDQPFTLPPTPASQVQPDETELSGLTTDEDDFPGDSDDFPTKIYEFREQPRAQRPQFPSTWYDRVESGNYGEKKSYQELKQERLKRASEKRKREERLRCTPNVLESERNDEDLYFTSPARVVKLELSSRSALAKVKEILSKPSAHHVNADPSPERQLRPRRATRNKSYNDDAEFREACSRLELPDNLTGDPRARGCKQCLCGGLDCGLLVEEQQWPCPECIEFGDDCELITPPTMKRACETCKRSRTSWAFSRVTIEQGEACGQCMEAGGACIAGPAKEYIRVRLRYDCDWESNPTLKKKAVKLISPDVIPIRRKETKHDLLDGFKKTKSDDSIDSLEKTRPGKSHDTFKAYGSDDDDYNIGVTDRVSKRLEKAKAAPTDNAEPTETIPTINYHESVLSKRAVPTTTRSSPENATQPSSMDLWRDWGRSNKKIVTKLCHPVRFNYTDKTRGLRPCHFCSEPIYAILGLGEVTVDVIERNDGSEYQEIEGGHRADDAECTRICAKCTLDRASIVACSDHALTPIPNAALTNRIALQDFNTGVVKPGTRFCALCPTLAEYDCSEACGLDLCQKDLVLLTGMYDGDLQAMMKGMKDEQTPERPLGLRADWELLKEEGLLMKYIEWTNRG